MIIPGVVITVKNKPRISLAKFVVSITSVISSRKGGKLLLKSLLSKGRYFRGVVTFGIRYFRRVASFAKGGVGGRYYRYLTVQEVHSI